MRKVIEVNRFGSLTDTASTANTGSGESAFNANYAATALTVGSRKKEPGRIYCDGRLLKNNNQTQYLNGANTPWHRWNEFGATSNGYDHTWWDAEFQRLVDRGINAIRVWVVCDATNEGVVVDADGICAAPTAKFWSDVDDLMTLATTYEIFVMPTLLSFDNFSWNTHGSQNWHRMFGDAARVQTLIDNYIVPFVERYKDNKWLWAVDLGNELDWLFEKADLATPHDGKCTPVGNGSHIVNFGQRVPDFVVGQQLYCISSGGVSYNMGLVVSRDSDTQVTCTNTFGAASEELTAGSGSGKWMFTGFTWRSIRRYLAMAAAAIHESESMALVSIGSGTIKYCSSTYGTDQYSDSLMIAETGNSLSVLDFHQIHWYSWAEPWYRLMLSPVANGLSAKPAIMGELPMRWEDMNIPSVTGWTPERWYNEGAIIVKNDKYDSGGTGAINFYRCSTVGGGNSGLDLGPTGQDAYNDVTEGGLAWRYLTHGSWLGNKAYSVYDMVISDINGWDPDYPPENGYTATPGRLYMCTTAGTSDQNGSGPTGKGTNISDGTVRWTYVREFLVDKIIGGVQFNEKRLYDFYIANGWCGHMPWTSNSVDANRGIYETHLTGEYLSAWAPLTDYYAKNEVLNDGNKLYRCITQGKSASSGGPTGTGDDIVDGDAHWKYVKTQSTPWTSAGAALKTFSDANTSSIYPDTSGTWTNRGLMVRQSRERARYTAGSDFYAILSFVFGNSEANLAQRVGLFDSLDGLFLEMSGADDDLSFVMRSNGVDVTYARTSWDDPMDGTGPSGVTLDFTTQQVLAIEFGWLHGGRTRCGFRVQGATIWAKEFVFTNTSSPVYPANPNLPLRWEISSDGALDAVRSMSSFNGYLVASSPNQGGPLGYNRNVSAIGVGGGDTREAMALRVASAMVRYSTFRPRRLMVVCTSGVTDYYFNWRIVLNPSYTGAGTYYGLSNSNVEVSTDRTVNAGTGVVLAQGFSRGDCAIDFNNLPFMGADALDVADILSVQINNIPNSQNWYYVTLEWDEAK